MKFFPFTSNVMVRNVTIQTSLDAPLIDGIVPGKATNGFFYTSLVYWKRVTYWTLARLLGHFSGCPSFYAVKEYVADMVFLDTLILNYVYFIFFSNGVYLIFGYETSKVN
jgi:hypothetical protein